MVLSMDRWVGKVAVVTGASAGIGASIAEALVKKGLNVVGLARRQDFLEALSNNLSNEKGKLYAVKTDVSNEKDVLNAFKWVKENLGPVHILVNSAGAVGAKDLADGDTETWRNVFNVNVLGLCIATREAIKDMRENNVDGHIIHISSIVGHKVMSIPEVSVYPASKYAVSALAETLRLELMNAKSKIKITNIRPGPVDTEIFTDSSQESEAYMKQVEEKLIIESDNISDGVVYALSTPPHVQIQALTITSVIEPFY